MQQITFPPHDTVFWYLNKHDIIPLNKNITTDVVVIGGGMAGLTAAQSFCAKGARVVLIEKNYCGAGATGKSSGFITPDSELSLHSLLKTYGADEAKKLWELVSSGVLHIKNTITNFQLQCDYQPQDTLIVANTHHAFTTDIQGEQNARQHLNYASTLYDEQTLPHILGSSHYKGGIVYGDSFSIDAYRYCLGMKHVLQQRGVAVYEGTPALKLEHNTVITPHATIHADHIIVCTDHLTPTLAPSFVDKVYHVQTFLMASAPLPDSAIKAIFPHRPLMVWDTDLIYNYYRLTGDKRLLLGGAHLWDTYGAETHDMGHIVKKLTAYMTQKFPQVTLQCEYIWPGLIGISKDLFPIAGHDAHMPSVYYITAAAGLPWAAALAMHSAERIINNDRRFDQYFSPYRAVPLGTTAQKILGTRLTFALSNFLTVRSL